MIYTAFVILLCTGFLHSYLGETRIIGPLLALPPQGVLKSPRARGILRGAWHITSLAWLALALLLVLAAGSPFEATVVWTTIAMAAASAAICLVSYGPMHPGFIAFTVCTAVLLVQRAF